MLTVWFGQASRAQLKIEKIMKSMPRAAGLCRYETLKRLFYLSDSPSLPVPALLCCFRLAAVHLDWRRAIKQN